MRVLSEDGIEDTERGVVFLTGFPLVRVRPEKDHENLTFSHVLVDLHRGNVPKMGNPILEGIREQKTP